MALADKLGDVPQRITGKPCSVGALEEYIEEHMPGKEADDFYAALYTEGLAGTRVFAAVQAEAVELRNQGNLEAAAVYAAMSLQQVNRHRSRACRCFKAAS